jgi:hypothetical protein
MASRKGKQMRTVQEMVQQEVMCCMSSMVSTLAQGYGAGIWDGGKAAKAVGDDLPNLIEQAFELASPVPDYEEAAIQEGWTGPHKDQFGATYFTNATESEQNTTWAAADWETLCRDFDIEPYEREVFEHWAVSDWFADKLIAHGEKVDNDFAGLCVWARCTTGQGIASDGVVERIHADLMKA